MHDPTWFRSLLFVHVLAGTCSFLLAPVALATVKGGKAHRLWGNVYFYSMAFVAATAFILAAYRPVLFLALVAVFSFYLSFAGVRVLRLKQMPYGSRPDVRLDWTVGTLTFATSLLLFMLSIFRPVLVQNMTIPGIVFGLLGMRTAAEALWILRHPPKEKTFWLFTHLNGMIGSYIAAWSAFSVVTLGPILGNSWYVWLWPTMIGVPAIAITSGYYRRKFDHPRIQKESPVPA